MVVVLVVTLDVVVVVAGVVVAVVVVLEVVLVDASKTSSLSGTSSIGRCTGGGHKC